ncbi:PREDICTED: 30S ribosomal [Prunus dulcis]|uniref:PREDICTED: 30S ribosomal n=1 Tax=Prunus dulcis TaxID=3755 RepID=A0A5E4FRC7_PRUDU|nr:uncharacterized protein LOC117627501 isoform X2 [Prunus dulcis]VVA30056.1 PREDICTED: 30S ribosomal [Prunus dulcis]
MDGFSLTLTSNATSFFPTSTRIPLLSSRTSRRLKTQIFPPKNTKFIVFSSKEEPRLDPLDQMEMKFGRLIGEDPKLTLAKILGRKANPEATYMEIEKSFYKNKGKLIEIKEVPFDGSKEVPTTQEKKVPFDGPRKVQSSTSLDGLNLVRPVPKKGVKFEVDYKPRVSEIKNLRRPVAKPVERTKSSVPNVILRKPTSYYEDDDEDMSSRLRIKPNLSVKMRNEQPKEMFSDMTLLRKPQAASVDKSSENKKEQSSDVDRNVIGDAELEEWREEENDEVSGFTLLEKPIAIGVETKSENDNEQLENQESSATDNVQDNNGLKDLYGSTATSEGTRNSLEESKDDSLIGLQQYEQSTMESNEEVSAVSELSDTNLPVSNVELSIDTALQGKPKRFDLPVKEASVKEAESNLVESGNLLSTSPIEGHEDADWVMAENLVKRGDRGDVELISASTRGFVVSFRSLIGFLPYRNLASKWKFLAFESWLRQKGLDPSLYRRNLGIIGSYDIVDKNALLNPSLDPNVVIKNDGEVSPDMKLEELLMIYDQEKIKFLSSFVGQKIKVNVVLANRKFGKLVFSVRPKEKEELVERKRSLMAKLQVGDVVKCCIKKITYFGIFVEVEGVPALIHQTEISWDATVDPSSYFKVGQILEAKVYQLDFSLERIFLSLKEIMPDPLMEALESVVGDRDSVDGRLEAAQADTEWVDVESLIKELQQTEGIQSVLKGRFFLSPGLAPIFQVYMASMFENQYKLLARSENKVQEVIVQTSLDKEEMKSVILTCTSRVG